MGHLGVFPWTPVWRNLWDSPFIVIGSIKWAVQACFVRWQMAF